jgi:ABC-type multidrug transport system ATPase subunit
VLVGKSKTLLLGEVTSALDSLSEMEALNALGRVGKQTVVVTVAHRLGPIRIADCILVLVEGRIVESGTPMSRVSGNSPCRCREGNMVTLNDSRCNTGRSNITTWRSVHGGKGYAIRTWQIARCCDMKEDVACGGDAGN